MRKRVIVAGIVAIMLGAAPAADFAFADPLDGVPERLGSVERWLLFLPLLLLLPVVLAAVSFLVAWLDRSPGETDVTGEPDKPKRSWWRKKRWWAAALLVSAVTYPASLAPAGYAVGRGWVSGRVVDSFYFPLAVVMGGSRSSPGVRACRNYASWWTELGGRHAQGNWGPPGLPPDFDR